MNSHKNARTTYEGRKLLIARIGELGLMPAAAAAGISVRTARKWQVRFLQEGPQGLLDRSSRPARTRSTIDAELRERIERLRRQRMPMRRIAAVVGRSVATQCGHDQSVIGLARFVEPEGSRSHTGRRPLRARDAW